MDKCVERGGPSLTVVRGKTHYAASLMSAADQQIPDDTRVVLEDLITDTGRWLADIGLDNGHQLTAHAMRGWWPHLLDRDRVHRIRLAWRNELLRVLGRQLQSRTRPVS